MALDQRVLNNASELVEALQNHLLMEGERQTGKPATFKSSNVRGSERGKRPSVSESATGQRLCYSCHKPGHLAWECPTSTGVSGAPKHSGKDEGSAKLVVCFHCGAEGHKRPQCPKKDEPKQPTSVRRVWAEHTEDVVLPGKVNSQECTFLLDSGARVSIVPEKLVVKEQLTGETVLVKAFKAADPMLLPLANVCLSSGGMEWQEEVAVIPEGEGTGTEVLYGLNLRSQRGLNLIMYANQKEVQMSERVFNINRVTTRAQNQAEAEEAKRVQAVLELERPKVKSLVGEEVSVEVVVPAEISRGGDTPAVQAEELARALDDVMESPYNPHYQLKQGCDRVELDIPVVTQDTSSKEELVKDVGSDPSLSGWRLCATEGTGGFLWEDGLVFNVTTSVVGEQVKLLALPLSARKNVLHLAHEGLGHMGTKRVLSLIKQSLSGRA